MCGQVRSNRPSAKETEKGRSLRTRGGLLALLGLLLACLAYTSGRAQTAVGDGVYYSQRNAFNIPFQTDPGERRVQQVQLYLSTDQGRTWKQEATAQPTERFFRFQARQEGWHWFAVRTIDLQGQGFPATVEQLQAGIKVCVDTRQPAVVLRPVNPPEGGLGVEWQVSDENLDLDSLRLEQRAAGGNWAPITTERAAAGRHSWNPSTSAALEVRLQVRDRAGNVGEQTATLTPAGNGGGGVGGTVSGGQTPRPPPGGGGPGPVEVRRVNSKRINLSYDLKDEGDYGVSKIELWYTRERNAGLWVPHKEVLNDPKPPYMYTVQVSEEGLYGFTLVAFNRVGATEKTPKGGEPPQVWVEVDLTKPKVQLLNVEVGKGADQGNLTISWSATDKNLSATDKNLGAQPITLAYAEKAEGPWTPIVSGAPNTGRYVWKMPKVPYQFFVRVEAVDLAGNVGSAHATQPVQVDLSRPKALISGVEAIPGDPAPDKPDKP